MSMLSLPFLFSLNQSIIPRLGGDDRLLFRRIRGTTTGRESFPLSNRPGPPTTLFQDVAVPGTALPYVFDTMSCCTLPAGQLNFRGVPQQTSRSFVSFRESA